jgi:YrbI family 3-deoxy-D-manno-octulosonate 8-phosphate phosphatase
MIPPSDVAVIIPARGGSKAVPRKNLRTVGGVSLIGRAVDAALAARSAGSVWVSTDDDEIAADARAHGARVVPRPAELAADETSSEAVLLHALDALGARGVRPAITVFVQCTAPFVHADDIDGVVNRLVGENADSAFAATYFPGVLWEIGRGGDAQAVAHDAAHRRRRQDLAPRYLEAGSVYAFRTEGFCAARTRFFGRVALYEIPRERCWEIDDERDLAVAEVLASALQPAAPFGALPARIAALVLDFDGVLTDNRVLVTSEGREGVFCNRSDGLGLGQLRDAGLPMLILSKERDPVVDVRARKLKIESITGADDKLAVLQKWLADRSIDPSDVVYVGNDVNDLDCIAYVGCGVAVSDAHSSVRAAAKIVLHSGGGVGAVRELTDMILPALRGGGR